MKKKIFKLTTIVCLSLFLLGSTITAHASTESQALVTEGRAFLFNDGNPTYSGIVDANVKFDAAVAADPSDQEANFFYAVTRVLVFALQQGGGTDLETLADLFEAFGMTRNDNDSLDIGSPYNDPPEIYGHLDLPETAPSGEEVRAFLAVPFVTLIDAAINNLDIITDTFNITLTVAETGDYYDIEVDYGDVLVLKSALYTFKSFFLIASAYNTPIDIREMAALGNAGILQIQRDLLDKYQSLLTLRGTDGADGAVSLTSAKAALLNGINAYEAAFNFITNESDPQENNLFYFSSDEDQREAEFVLTQLTELKNSLSGNRPAVFTIIDETWIFTDTTTNDQLELSIDKDVYEKFIWGDYWWGLNGCNFISCGGWVESFSVSGTSVMIELAYGGMYSGSATFTGTIIDGTNILGTYTEYDGLGNVVVSDKNFTATLANSETETETIDFNCIFGNNTAPVKPPLDIRAILPQFDQYDEPVPGSFGEPILNGILPDVTTNDDLTRELELQPSGFFNIPTVTDGTISVDGISSDWPSGSLAFTDIENDENENADFVGMDIHELYLAKDTTYLYMGFQLYDGNPNTVDLGPGYVFQANASYEESCSFGDRTAAAFYTNEDWIASVSERSVSDILWGQLPTLIASYDPSYAADGTNFIEYKVLLNDMGNLSGKFIHAYSHVMDVEPGNPPINNILSDQNITRIMLDSASITGTITVTGTGNIFVWAFDGPDWRSAHELGNAVADASGNYTITGLPIGSTVYLFARWDADFNGVKTLGDYVGKTGPITVLSEGTTDADFSVDTLLGFSGQEKVYPVKRGDKDNALYLAFWAQVPYPYAQSVSVICPGIATPINLSGNTMYPSNWSAGIPVSDLDGSIQTGTYTFEATGSGGGTVVSTTFDLASVPSSTPEPATLVSPYEGTPDVEMTLETTTPTFTWTAASGAQAHKLRIDQKIDGNWSRIYDSGWPGLATTHTVQTSLPTGVPLRWYVDAYDGSDWDSTTATSRSVRQKFTIDAIGNGLQWLSQNQNTDGSWGDQYALAKTALAVLNFEKYAISRGYSSPFDVSYPYHTNVENGLNYIFSMANTVEISLQPAGNPDGDGDSIGVYFTVPDEWHSTYYTSIAMMAIAASGDSSRDVNVPGSPVNGWTYGDVLQDIVDCLAYAQTDSGVGRGGWSYNAMYSNSGSGDWSDQSNSGWVTLGLAYAEADPPDGFGLNIPDFVRTELEYWIDNVQNVVDGDDDDGGAHYQSKTDGNGANMLRTGNLLQQMAFVGDTETTQRVQNAIAYLVRHWEWGWSWNPSCYHTTYTTMKGLEALGIETIDSINWFQDFSDALRSEQSIHGWWPVSSFDTGDSILSTEWAMLTLQKAVAPTEENPDLEVTQVSQQWVDEAAGTYTVYYTVKNRGNITALAGHDVDLTVDGAAIEQQTVLVALAPGANSDTFTTVVTLSGFADEITVCADINGEVDELNEDNNCVTNIWPPPIKGDLNGDRDVNLADAILALQVLSGLNPDGIHLSADVDEDGKIGLAEAIYILQDIAGLR